MTIPNAASEPVHVSDSVLSYIAKYTRVDIDNNVASIALQHNLANRKLLEGSSAEVDSIFMDMTSNQLIVRGVIVGLLEADPAKGEKLIRQSIDDATEILKFKSLRGSPLSDEAQARLAIKEAGLSSKDTGAVQAQQLAVDVLTAHIGLEMLPHLLSNGHLHAQTLPSLAYDSAGTVSHARRLVALYELLSGGQVGKARVCIKIPSTIEGIRAIRYLESGGKLDEHQLGSSLTEGPIKTLGSSLTEGPIKTLGTTVFAVEQGLAGAQAGKTQYVAPYINALAAHFFSVENPSGATRAQILEAGERSLPEVILPLQRCLTKLRAESPEVPTLVMAASFLRDQEAIDLCGLDHVTLGAPVIAGLSCTKVDETTRQQLEKARASFLPGNVEEEFTRYGGRQGQLDGSEWLREGSELYTQLDRKLREDDRCRFMLADALARFRGAEQDLCELVGQRI